MSIKVSFNAGERSATASGLYQWDYGQVLEIECAELGTELMEVHFACSNMSEAIVRTCQFVDGVGTVTIPDQCLEQTSNITAWIYSISATQGHTVKTITMPITSRTRPSALRDVPSEYVDKYAEAIGEINEAVNALEQGTVTVAKALSADEAGHATTAGSAESATYATSAGSATTAGSANTANSAAVATALSPELIATCEITNGEGTAPTETKYHKLCAVVFSNDEGETNCGVYYEMSSASVHYARIGAFNMVNDGTTITLTKDDTLLIHNGTLYFYQLNGGVSA